MADGYLAFVSTPSGYELREEQGDPPNVGDTVEQDGKSWRVVKIGPSPLPRDSRTCAYLQG